MTKSERAIKFISNLKLVKDKWRGKKFKLSDWQRDYVQRLYQDNPEIKRSLLLVPKKNGKTTLIAAICVFELLCGVQGGEIISAANTRDQASLVFKTAAEMIRLDPTLKSLCIIRDSKKLIRCPGRNSSYQAISADAGDKNGVDPSLVIYDELCDARSDELLNILTTAQAARPNPKFLIISTAGWDRQSALFREYEYAKKVRDGLISDPGYLAVIYEADPDDDYTAPETWAKANPNWGISVNPDFVKEQVKKCEEQPSYLNSVLRYHLNLWVQSDSRFLPADKWRECGELPFDISSLAGRCCYCGLDLASNVDVASLALLFKLDDGRYVLLSRYWIPEENAIRREKTDRVPYLTWAKAGYVSLTPGDVIDFDRIRQDILKLKEQYDIKEIAIDRWNATQITTQLQGDGLNIVPFGQGFGSMSAPTKELEALVMSKKFLYVDNPVTRWMGSNVICEQDASGNLKPSKARSSEKIDGIVAAVMALGRLIASPENREDGYLGPLVF